MKMKYLILASALLILGPLAQADDTAASKAKTEAGVGAEGCSTNGVCGTYMNSSSILPKKTYPGAMPDDATAGGPKDSSKPSNEAQ